MFNPILIFQFLERKGFAAAKTAVREQETILYPPTEPEFQSEEFLLKVPELKSGPRSDNGRTDGRTHSEGVASLIKAIQRGRQGKRDSTRTRILRSLTYKDKVKTMLSAIKLNSRN